MKREIEMTRVFVYGEPFEVPKVLTDELLRLREVEREQQDRLTEEMKRAWERESGRSWADLEAETAALPSPWVEVAGGNTQ